MTKVYQKIIIRQIFMMGYILFGHQVVHAGVWFFSAPDYQESLQIENHSNEDVQMQLSTEYLEESQNRKIGQDIAFVIQSNSKKNFTAKELVKGAWLRLRSYEDKKNTQSIAVHMFKKVSQQVVTEYLITEGRSTRKALLIPKNFLRLKIQNSSSYPQLASLSAVESVSQRKILQTQLSLEPREIKTVELNDCATENCQLVVSSNFNLIAWVENTDSKFYLNAVAESCSQQNAGGVRFVLSNRNHTSSYTVELQDPSMIEQARRLIQNPSQELAQILIAQVDVGHNFINKNYLDTRRSYWSWHVSQPIKFAQIASTYCEGNPDYLEDYLKPWLTSGRPICFWNYRVVAELKPICL